MRTIVAYSIAVVVSVLLIVACCAALVGCGVEPAATRCIVTAQCPAGESCGADHQCMRCGTSTCDPEQVCWHFNCLNPCEVPDAGCL